MKEDCFKESDAKDFRCVCGSLMARFSEKGLELKCKRCKRIHLIPFSDVVIAPSLLNGSDSQKHFSSLSNLQAF